MVKKMNDVVISARITKKLLDELEKLGKPKSEIVNDALRQYVSKNTNLEPRIHHRIQKNSSCKYQSLREAKLRELHCFIDNLNQEV